MTVATTEPKHRKIDPPRYEVCDHKSCPAWAMVAVGVPLRKSTGRLVFCGHHYDQLPAKLRQKLLPLTHDLRGW